MELSNKSSLSESATLAAQMESLKSRSTSTNSTDVGSDLIGDAKTRVLKLELENQRLEGEVEKLKRENQLNFQDKLLELEKENKRLSIKVGFRGSNLSWLERFQLWEKISINLS